MAALHGPIFVVVSCPYSNPKKISQVLKLGMSIPTKVAATATYFHRRHFVVVAAAAAAVAVADVVGACAAAAAVVEK